MRIVSLLPGATELLFAVPPAPASSTRWRSSLPSCAPSPEWLCHWKPPGSFHQRHREVASGASAK
jgi:hypothetical protein